MTARVREQIAKLGRAAAPVFDGHVGLSQPIVRTFAWLSDSDLKAIIERDYAEVQVALFPSRAWKSCVVMCGSILESVLYDVLRNSQPRIDAASKSAKAPTGKSLTGGKWELWNLIEVAADIGVLPREREESIDVVLRDYRNFVHPLKEKRLQHPCGEGEAMMAFGGLIGVCDHLEKTAAANGGLP